MMPDTRWLTTPDGARLRLVDWRPAGEVRGTVALVTGRAEFADKYAETAGDFMARGWAVRAMDWRGQGLSDRFLADRLRGHLPDYRHLVDDLEGMLTGIERERPGPILLFAHSMGGHVALRCLSERSPPVAAAILSAPMCGLPRGGGPALRAMARTMSLLGRAANYAPGQGPHEPRTPASFPGNVLTHDPTRFMLQDRLIAADPNLAIGGVTWGWLDATLRSMRHMLRPGAVERIAVPVLVLVPGDDRVVRVDRMWAVARRLRQGRGVGIPGAAHEIMMETDALRGEAWRAIDAFLADIGLGSTTPA